MLSISRGALLVILMRSKRRQKKGGQSVYIRRTELLAHFLSTIHGESIIVKGQPFTWKRWVHASWIYERLDRSIARFNFARLYPNLFLIIIPLLLVPNWSTKSKNLLRFVFKAFGIIIGKWKIWSGSAENLTLKDP